MTCLSEGDGNAGNDTLIGGTGVDLMNGGTGDDLFFVDDSSDQVFDRAGEGNDRVFTGHSFTLAAGQEIETLSTDATGALDYDADGNGAGAAVQFATLTGAPSVNARDFIVI